MSVASRRARAKRRGKRGKVAKAQRGRTAVRPYYGQNVAALALTGQDLGEWQWAVGTLRRYQIVEREVTHTCSQCGQVDRINVRFELDEVRDAVGALDRLLGKVGTGGASLWFAKQGG